MDVLTNFSEFYIKIEEMQKSMRVSNEMERIYDEYSSAYEAANEYLQSRQDDRSSMTSDTLTIEMLERMNISETSKKELRALKTFSTTANSQIGTVLGGRLVYRD